MTNIITSQCRALSRAIKQPKELWREVVHPWMVQHFRRQFDTAGGHGGALWAPLEPKYQAAQRAFGDSIVPLESSAGILERSFVDPTDKNHRVKFGRTMEFESALPYSGTLATGGTGPYGEPFPARDPRVISRVQMEDLKKEIYAWFRKQYDRFEVV